LAICEGAKMQDFNDIHIDPFALIPGILVIACGIILLGTYFLAVKRIISPEWGKKKNEIIRKNKMDSQKANDLFSSAHQPFHYAFRAISGVFLIGLFFAILSLYINIYESPLSFIYKWSAIYLRYFKYALIFAPIFFGTWMLFNSNAIYASDIMDGTYNKIRKNNFDIAFEDKPIRLVNRGPKDIRNYGKAHLLLGLILVAYQFVPHPGLPDIFDLINNIIPGK
jgi:hypothetical protein